MFAAIFTILILFSLSVPADGRQRLQTGIDHPARTAGGSAVNHKLPDRAKGMAELSSDRIILFEDSFDTYEDFSDSMGAWTLIDLDLTNTYRIEEATYPGEGGPMAYIVFNPSATNPPLDGNWIPADGNKYAASFSSLPGEGGPNDDWLITPRIGLKSQSEVRFLARSVTAEYGLEQFRVGVSTTTPNPVNFDMITGFDPLEAPAEWTEFRFDLSEFDNDSVYVVIHCVSDDRFVFMVDDFQVTGVDDPVSIERISELPSGAVLYQNYPNPFNPATNIRYYLDEPADVSLKVFDLAGREIAVLAAGRHAKGYHTAVFDAAGIASGVYLYRMDTGNKVLTRKLLLIR
jgi:hypothetical protein